MPRIAESLIRTAWEHVVRRGTIRAGGARAARFGRFGDGSSIVFPSAALFGERWIWIGSDSMIGPYASLSAGMRPGQQMVTDPVVRIGDRCLIGRGTSIVGHFEITIGDDVCTGPNCYITDQNHGYEDVDRPIIGQAMTERPVHIGPGSWLGTGVVVLPGSTIGAHVAVAANSVVAGDLPDTCVAAGNPARVIRVHTEDGWMRVPNGGRADAES